MINIQTGNRELVKEYFGKIPNSMRCLVVTDDAKPLAVAGIYVENNHIIMFSNIKPEAREIMKDNIRTVIKVIRRLKQMAGNRVIYSLADPDIEGSRTVLEHMGFTQHRGDTYVWHP